MESIGNDRREFVRTIYREHWAQIRQVERERIWLLLVFAVIAAGVLTAMRDDWLSLRNLPPLIFLTALSVFGFLLSIKMQIIIKAHLRAVEYILTRYSLQHYLPPYRQSFIRRRVRISRLVSNFFLFSAGFFGWTLLYITTGRWRWPLVLTALIYVALSLTVCFSKYDEPLPLEKD
jgi:cation transporter-like permease